MFQSKPESLADVKNKWEKSSWGRKLIVQKRRANLNDFDRFKIMLAKIKVSVLNCQMWENLWSCWFMLELKC